MERRGCLPYINVRNPLTGKIVPFLIDSDSEVNLLKDNLLSDLNIIDKSEIIYLQGIGSTLIPTLGKIDFKILGFPGTFHVIFGELNIPEEGILGMKFLKGSMSILDYDLFVLRNDDYSSDIIFKRDYCYLEP